jgi:hypothetical protein
MQSAARECQQKDISDGRVYFERSEMGEVRREESFPPQRIEKVK